MQICSQAQYGCALSNALISSQSLQSFWWALEKCRDCRVWLAALRRKRWNLWNSGSLRQSSMSECYAESLWYGIVQNISPLKHKAPGSRRMLPALSKLDKTGSMRRLLGTLLGLLTAYGEGGGLDCRAGFLLPSASSAGGYSDPTMPKTSETSCQYQDELCQHGWAWSCF